MLNTDHSATGFPRWQIGTLTFVHFMMDFYSSILPPLLPLIIAKFSLSLTLAGSLVSTYSLSSALLQPIFGLLSDRLHGRVFIFWGPLFTTLFISLVGWSPSYLSLVILLFLAGLGISAFHPQGTAVVGQEAKQKRALAISVFLFGGTLGFAVGPLVITWWTSSYGLGSVFAVGVPGIISVLLCFRFVPYSNLLREKGRGKRLLGDLRFFLKPLALLFTVVMVTSVVRLGLASFMPVVLTEEGVSLPMVGLFLSACAFLGSTGSMVGAIASGRWGRKKVMVIAMVLSLPLFQYYFINPGTLGLVLIAFGSATIMSPYSVIVAIGQEAIPQRSGTVSALLMGFGWGMAGLMMTPIGLIAEYSGLVETLRWTVLLPVVAVSAILMLSDRSLASKD